MRVGGTVALRDVAPATIGPSGDGFERGNARTAAADGMAAHIRDAAILVQGIADVESLFLDDAATPPAAGALTPETSNSEENDHAQ